MSTSLLKRIRSLLGERQEERLAESVSVEALQGLLRTREMQPGLSGEALYRQVMSEGFGLDEAAAQEIVAGARESYAEWPIERDLKFSDVVHYFVVRRCLREIEPQDAPWIHGRIDQIVRDLIPQAL